MKVVNRSFCISNVKYILNELNTNLVGKFILALLKASRVFFALNNGLNFISELDNANYYKKNYFFYKTK